MSYARKKKQAHNHPAFPVPAFAGDANIPPTRPNSGMGMRDWFAGLAMQSIISAKIDGHHEVIADLAYDMADAMMERKEED